MDIMDDYIDPGVSIGTEVYTLSAIKKTALFTRTRRGNIGVFLDSETAIGQAHKFAEDTISALPYTPLPRHWTFTASPAPNMIWASGSWTLTLSTTSPPSSSSTTTESLTLKIKRFHIRDSVAAESYSSLKATTRAKLSKTQAQELEAWTEDLMEEEWWSRYFEGGNEGDDEDSDWEGSGEGDSDDEMEGG